MELTYTEVKNTFIQLTGCVMDLWEKFDSLDDYEFEVYMSLKIARQVFGSILDDYRCGKVTFIEVINNAKEE